MAFADDYISSVLGFTPTPKPEPAEVNARIHQPLTPEEETSQLKRLLGYGTSALGFVGGQLDKFTGSRAVRGLLAGKPRELLSVLPASDSLGITNEEDRTSGEELAKNVGLLQGEGTKGEFELRDLVGPALEIGLDPTSYLTFGASALTKAGQAARKLGALPGTTAGRIAGHAAPEAVAKAMGLGLPEATQLAGRVGINLDDLVGKPLGGFAGVRNFPVFGHANPDLIAGTGAGAQKWADRMANVGDAIAYSGPGRHISAAVDPRVLGRTEETFQRVARDQDKASKVREALTNLSATGVAGDTLYDKAFHGIDPDVVRAGFEGTSLPGGGIPYNPDVLDAITQMSGRFRSADAAKLAEAQAAAVKVKPLDSIYGTEHASRQLTPLAKEPMNWLPDQGGKPGFISRLMGRKVNERMMARTWPTLQRESILDVPGGTPMLNEMARELPGMTPAAAEQAIRSKYFQFDPQRLQNLLTGEATARAPAGLSADIPGVRAELEGLLAKPAAERTQAIANFAHLNPAEGEDLLRLLHQDVNAPGLASYMSGLPAERKQLGLMVNDPLLDARGGWGQLDQSIKRSNIVNETLARSAILSPSGVPQNAQKFGVVLRNAGLDTKPATQRLLDSLNAGEAFGPGVTGTVRDMAKVYVPNDVAKALVGIIPAGEAPAFTNPLIRVFDEATKLTRAGLTAPWPGFHVRNLASSFWQNLTSGASGPGIGGAGIMQQLRSGVEEIPGLAKSIPYFAGMTDKEATRALGQQMFATRGAGSKVLHPLADALDPLTQTTRGLADVVPGAMPQPGLGESLGTLKGIASKKGIDPRNIGGFMGRTTTEFAPAKSGQMVGSLIDDLARGGQYADLMQRGYIPQAASEVAQGTHFDYGRNLTDFERRYIRRLVPFYGWQKNVIPQQIGQLLREPGGIAGQSIRLANDVRQDAGFIPPYLGGGMAIPLGQQDDGTQRYLTKLDLPFENPWETLKPGQGVGNSLMSLLGQLNPLLKGPLELATNRQFYSGRNLDDLYGNAGMPSNLSNALVYNAPWSRAATAVRTLGDDRKGPLAKLLNLGTGVKVSDVDMNKQAAFTELDLLRQAMRNNPNSFQKFEEFSPRKDAMQNLSQDDIDTLRLYRALEKRQQEKSKLAHK